MRLSRRLVVLLCAVLVPLAAAVFLAVHLAGSRGPAPEVYGQVPAFSLVERSGRRMGLADLKGGVWLANFMYTTCQDTCPTQSLELSRLQAEFADAPEFRLVSITVDPLHDTPAVLRRYAQSFGATERWLFLTGDVHDIRCLATVGFRLPVDGVAPEDCARRLLSLGPVAAFAHEGEGAAHPGSPEPLIHSDRLVLIDRRGQIRGYHGSSERGAVDQLRAVIRHLLAEP